MSGDVDPLFTPLSIGNAALPNRVVLSAMTTGFGYHDGLPDDRLLEHFALLARDVGLATVAFGAVRPEGRVERKIPWMWAPGIGDRLRPLVEVIHGGGAKASLQLGHGGRQVSPKVTGQAPVAPSAIPPAVHVKQPPVELSTAEAYEIIDAFVKAAVIAAAAGFDAVEVPGGHGYLVQQFLSSQSNHRADEFGGRDIMERAAFGRAILRGIKGAVPDLALIVRINGDDLVPGGMGPSDAVDVARAFAGAGADALIVSGGVYGSVPWTIPVLDDREPAFIEAARTVKEAVDIPVIAVGGFRAPDAARSAIARGDCDGVALGRHLLADPGWVAKARAGAADTIRPCVATLQGCAGPLQIGGEISCVVNPTIGRPSATPRRGLRRRRVGVVGGGPAGLEAARAAAEAGDEVILWEARERLGGVAALAGTTPPLGHFSGLVRWYGRELERLGVDVRLGTKVAAHDAALDGMDVLVCAVGAEILIPEIEGYELLPAWASDDLLAGEPSTHGALGVPERLVVVGDGAEALAVALWLVEHGSSVTVVAEERFGADTSGVARRALRARLDAAGVALVKGNVRALAEGRVELDQGGVEADAIVLAGRRGPVRWSSADAHRVGDAREPRGLGAAIEEGRMAVHALT